MADPTLPRPPAAPEEPFAGICTAVPLTFNELHLLISALNAAPLQGLATVKMASVLFEKLDAAQTNIRAASQIQKEDLDALAEEQANPPG